MYYLKLASVPIITLSPQALESTSTPSTTFCTSTTQTSTSVSTTLAGSSLSTTNATTTASKSTLVLEASESNLHESATGISKLKSQVPPVVGSCMPLKASTKRQNNSNLHATSSSNIVASVVKLDNSISPSSNGGYSSSTGSGVSVAAARLIGLGKKLLEATREGRTETVRRLIVESGAPFASDWLGTTALHIAAQNGYVEIAEILLNGGVNCDAKTKLDRTALHLAAQSGSVEIIDLLIASGADVRARDMLKMTPLHWAVERNQLCAIERLIVAGSDLTAENKFQLTPIDIARESQCYDVIKLLNDWMGANGTNGSSHSTLVISDSTSNQPGQHLTSASMNFGQDLNLLFNFGTTSFSEDDSPLIAQVTNTAGVANLCKTNQQRQQHQKQQQQSSSQSSMQISPNDFRDFINFDHQLALLDCSNDMVGTNMRGSDLQRASCNTTLASGSSSNSPENRCIDLVELEWNNLDLVPELFMPTKDGDDGGSNVEYLMKIVEGLQKENKQLRQQVEQLSTTGP